MIVGNDLFTEWAVRKLFFLFDGTFGELLHRLGLISGLGRHVPLYQNNVYHHSSSQNKHIFASSIFVFSTFNYQAIRKARTKARRIF